MGADNLVDKLEELDFVTSKELNRKLINLRGIVVQANRSSKVRYFTID